MLRLGYAQKRRWILIAPLIAFLGVLGILSQLSKTNASQWQTERENAIVDGLLISYNALLPISLVEFPHIQVLASKIVDCESGGNNDAIGKAGERGIAQFKEATFKWMSELSGMNGDWLNEEDQWNLLLWALEEGYEYHWTCFGMVK